MVPSVSALEVVDCIGMLFDNFTCQVCAVCSFQVYFALFSNLEIMQGGPPRAVSARRCFSQAVPCVLYNGQMCIQLNEPQ